MREPQNHDARRRTRSAREDARCGAGCVMRCKPLLDRGRHFGDRRSIAEAPRALAAAALVMTPARCVSRHRHIVRRPRPVAMRVGRTEQRRRWACRRRRRGAAARCPRTPSVRPRAHSASRSAMPVGGRDPRGAGRRARRPHPPALPRPAPQHERRQAATSRRNAATSPNRSGGHRLFGHAAPGLISANGRSPPSVARTSPAQPTRPSASGKRIVISSMPSVRSSPRFLRMTWPPPRVRSPGIRMRSRRRYRTDGPLSRAGARSRNPITRARAGRTREHRRLHQPLEINRHVVAHLLAACATTSSHPASDGRSSATTRSTDGDQIHDRAVLRVDQPVDPRVRIRARAAPPRRERRGRCRRARRAGRSGCSSADSGRAGRAWNDPWDRRRSRCGRRTRAPSSRSGTDSAV